MEVHVTFLIKVLIGFGLVYVHLVTRVINVEKRMFDEYDYLKSKTKNISFYHK
jgi:hypothetical protein